MVTTFAEALMGAEADAVCGAGYGERNGERRNTRNGYRRREWNTRAGSIELGIPKLRQGSYFPDWLLARPAPGRGGAGHGGGRVLPARGLRLGAKPPAEPAVSGRRRRSCTGRLPAILGSKFGILWSTL